MQMTNFSQAICVLVVGFLSTAAAAERSVHITLEGDDPIVVARAPVELNRAGGGWGRWQFPTISRLADGRLLVTYSLEPDSYASYGKPVGYAYSADDGRTWQSGKPKTRAEVEPGVLLPNGERLKPVELTSLRAEELTLPEPVCNFVCSYGYPRSLYRADKLPAAARGWCFSRWNNDTSAWTEETATVHIPDELLHVTAEEARGFKPSIDKTDAVESGPLARPYLWGKIRIAPDSSIWGVTYLWRMVNERPRYAPVFLRSTDVGATWDMHSEITYVENRQEDKYAEIRDGFTEPDYNFRPDGSIICVIRTMDGNGHGPLFLTRSDDAGQTWSTPVGFDAVGKVPQLLTLENGVTICAYGASGGRGYFVVRATTDPAGLQWGPHFEVRHTPVVAGAWDTCGHTELVAVDADTALLVYSDFNYRDEEDVPRKTILVRRINITLGDDE